MFLMGLYIVFDAWVIDFTVSKAKNTVFKHIIVGAANIFQHQLYGANYQLPRYSRCCSTEQVLHILTMAPTIPEQYSALTICHESILSALPAISRTDYYLLEILLFCEMLYAPSLQDGGPKITKTNYYSPIQVPTVLCPLLVLLFSHWLPIFHMVYYRFLPILLGFHSSLIPTYSQYSQNIFSGTLGEGVIPHMYAENISQRYIMLLGDV